MTATKRRAGLQHSEADPPSRDQMEALARMIEYASLEARESGLFLTAHLLDLAGWSVQEAQANAEALARQRTHGPGETRVARLRPAADSEKIN